MTKAALMALLVVTGSIQAEIAYVCSMIEEPTRECCPEGHDSAAMEPDCDTATDRQENPPCDFPLLFCMEQSVSVADAVARSEEPAAACHGTRDPPPTSIVGAVDPPVAPQRAALGSGRGRSLFACGAGQATYLLTQRLRI